MTSISDGTDRYIHFGEFVFDTDSDELYRGENRVVIQPQPAKLLRLFLSRDGRLLSHAEITNYIWPKTIVDYEQRVRSAVGDIRTALDDDHEHPRYIETVSRRGYRFIFPIQSKVDEQRFQTRRKLAILAAITLGALFAFGLYVLAPDSEIAAGDKNRAVLVVLPVSEIVTGDIGRFPVDGLTHELIAQTAGLAPSALGVIGRTSAMKYKGTTLTTAQIASDLGADYLLETTIGELETGLRATSTLVESASGQVVWSTQLDGSFGDLQAFEVEIAYGVGQALGIKPEVDLLATTATDSTDSEAYEAYLTGLYLISQKSTEQKALSYDFFKEAISQDPIFAPAYLGVARSIVYTERPEAEFWEAIDKALELDDRSADAYYQRALKSIFHDWNWADADRDFRTAIRIDPGQAKYHEMYAAYLRAAGDYQSALVEAELGLELDPLSELVNRDMSWLFIAMGNYERAIEHCERGLRIELDHPEIDHNCLMLTYRELGNIENAAVHAREIMRIEGVAKQEIAELSALDPQFQMEAFWQWKLAREQAHAEANRNHFQIAAILSVTGHLDEALDTLETALNKHEFAMIFIGGDPQFKPLRGDPRFLAIARKVGIPAFMDPS